MPLTPRRTSDDMVGLKQAAIARLGIVALPGYVCREDLRSGTLCRVLPAWLAGDFDVDSATALPATPPALGLCLHRPSGGSNSEGCGDVGRHIVWNCPLSSGTLCSGYGMNPALDTGLMNVHSRPARPRPGCPILAHPGRKRTGGKPPHSAICGCSHERPLWSNGVASLNGHDGREAARATECRTSASGTAAQLAVRRAQPMTGSVQRASSVGWCPPGNPFLTN